jgi:hypothetical protein
MPNFKLLPEENALGSLAEQYWIQNSSGEREAFEAGTAILNGDRSIDSLATIVRWKSPRVVHHLKENPPEVIGAALDVAVHNSNLRDALSALQGLKGVGLPMASAILTAIYPDRYTVIDFRALEALDYAIRGNDFYIAYLEFCRSLARSGVIAAQEGKPAPTALRALDRALWQWSANGGKKQES